MSINRQATYRIVTRFLLVGCLHAVVMAVISSFSAQPDSIYMASFGKPVSFEWVSDRGLSASIESSSENRTRTIKVYRCGSSAGSVSGLSPSSVCSSTMYRADEDSLLNYTDAMVYMMSSKFVAGSSTFAYWISMYIAGAFIMVSMMMIMACIMGWIPARSIASLDTCTHVV